MTDPTDAFGRRLPRESDHADRRRRLPQRPFRRVPQDEDDWVGMPPEGRYTRDRSRPEFWSRSRIEPPSRRQNRLLAAFVVLLAIMFTLVQVVELLSP